MFKSDIGVKEIKKRIARFHARKKDKSLNENMIFELTSIFGNHYSVPCEQLEIPYGVEFFRARGIPSDDNSIPFKTISHIGDAWEPPSNFVRYPGRLNNINQSILYCCPHDPMLAIQEARASENQFVAIIKYVAVRNINISVLGNYTNSTLPKDKLTKLFYNFLDKEFSQDVPTGEEERYAITRSAADTFSNLPGQDAWLYRSVQSPKKFNVAFLPNKQKECLKLIGVMIWELNKAEKDKFKVLHVIDFDKLTGVAQYHEMGSEHQRKIFPELVAIY
ncbi:RES domain-containing protein [Acinetobacter calcoaceticus]